MSKKIYRYQPTKEYHNTPNYKKKRERQKNVSAIDKESSAKTYKIIFSPLMIILSILAACYVSKWFLLFLLFSFSVKRIR